MRTSVTLTGLIVTGNSASNGGGLALDATDAVLDSSSEISQNQAVDSGGGVLAMDGCTMRGGSVLRNGANYCGGFYWAHSGFGGSLSVETQWCDMT